MQGSESKTIFSFYGPPGSGKGTLAQMCSKKLEFPVLSLGNLCRKHVELKTEVGRLIDSYLKSGRLIPDDLITNIVGDWLIFKSQLGVPIILDGYPRTKGQADFFLKEFENFVPNYSFKVMNFLISEKKALERLSGRFVCENKDCQAVYHHFFDAEIEIKCDLCGSKLIRRKEDELQMAQERLKRFLRYREELLNFYKFIEQSIQDFNVENRTIEQIFKKFKEEL